MIGDTILLYNILDKPAWWQASSVRAGLSPEAFKILTMISYGRRNNITL
jgi:hypothetical protein